MKKSSLNVIFLTAIVIFCALPSGAFAQDAKESRNEARVIERAERQREAAESKGGNGGSGSKTEKEPTERPTGGGKKGDF